jgi:hypothetical protein
MRQFAAGLAHKCGVWLFANGVHKLTSELILQP